MGDLFDSHDPAAPQKPRRADKRQAILVALAEDPSRSDREIGRLLGLDGKTVAKLRSAEFETPHPAPGGEIDGAEFRSAEIETPHSAGAETLATILSLLPQLGPADLNRVIIAAEARGQTLASSSAPITVWWNATRAAALLCKQFEVDWLNKFRAALASGGPTPMMPRERARLFGTSVGRELKGLELDAADPAAAAARLWLYWGHHTSKMQVLYGEVTRRMGVQAEPLGHHQFAPQPPPPPPPRPQSDDDPDSDMPF